MLLQNARVALAAQRERADLIWIRSSKGIAFGALGGRLAGRRLIWDVDFEPESKGIVRILHRLGLRLSSKVIYQYQAAAEEIFGKSTVVKTQSKHISIVPGIDSSRILSESGVSRPEEESQDAKQAFQVLLIGTVCDRKNQRLAIEILSVLKNEYGQKNVKLLCAGGVADEVYLRDIKAYIEEARLQSDVEFLGWRDDIVALMRSADLLILPSQNEGVPNCVQEAMLLSLPVMVSSVGGLPQVVTNDVTGWVIDSWCPRVWANKLNTVIQDSRLRNEVTRRANLHALENFSTDTWGKRYAHAVEAVNNGCEGAK
ncbi:glycosyltransferase [Alkalilimnicola ehrlichii]|uniref:Glycosyl transferase family 1 domain-containing protein n=1 Tax=Alkalilimnicola ehrlichii TaxID=351052 RepID=A0A3E0X0N7_9GAMM|nr:glycosyltransferase [Alkalilimnicola ehrlichii]RFA37825.1 hypothetical protein CAL65_07740 [Alkalilimnicola ehrlichii]